MSKNNQFKKSKAYKIIVACLILLYFGYQIYTGEFGQEAQNTDSGYVQEEQNVDSGYAQEEQDVDYEYAQEEQDADSEYAQEEQEYQEQQYANGSLEVAEYSFRSEKLLEEHYEKHGIEMGFSGEEEYLQAANAVLSNPDTLHKIEEEDGDDVYFLEATNEFVVVSRDGYIRTYFYPEDGIEYFNRQ